jgi:hypothetical protein
MSAVDEICVKARAAGGVGLRFRGAGRAAMRVIRLAALAAVVVAGGCWWHESAVPAITEADRAAKPPLRNGVYCNVDAGETSLQLEDDCGRFEWDASQHRISVTEIDRTGQKGQRMWVDVSAPADNVIVMQYDESQEAGGGQSQGEKTKAEGDAAHRYTVLAIMPRREGYVVIPLPPPSVRDAIAAEEGVTIEPPGDPSDYGRILAGSPQAVRRVVTRSAVAWLKSAAPPKVDKLAPYDPDADETFHPPHYVLRIEALDNGLDERAATKKGVHALYEALQRALKRLK